MPNENTVATVLVAGLPHHGKTTVAMLFAKVMGVPAANTSDVIYEELARITGRDVAALMKLDKESIRDDLINTGDRLCRSSPAALLEELSSRGFVVIAGVRKKCEVDAFRASGRRTVIVWVERHGHGTVSDNTNLSKEDADVVVYNSGGVRPIMTQIRRIIREQVYLQ